MQNILKASMLYRLVATIGAFFHRQWVSSALLGRFLAGAAERENGYGGVLSLLWDRLISALRTLAKRLRLDKLLAGSIFTYPAFWCALTLAVTPIIPTMASAGLACVCIFSLLVKTITAENHIPHRHPATRFIILFALLYTAAIFTSVTISGSLKGGALQVLFTITAVIVGASLTDRKSIERTVWAFVASGLLVSLYGMYQYLSGVTGASAWVDSEMFAGIGLRVYSTLDNPNVLAEYLLLAIPFAAAALLSAKNALSRLFFLGSLGAMLLCMVLTLSRGGWIGLIVAAAIFLVLLDRRFILAGIIGLVALYFFLPDMIISRLFSIGDLKDGSTSYRLSIWLGTLSMLRDYWLVGIGPGVAAFSKVYPIYAYSAAASQHSHNLFLQITCDAGICGLVAFLLVLVTYLRSVCAALARRPDKTVRLLLIAAISSVSGFLVQGLTDHAFYNYRVTLIFWIIIGVGIATSRLTTQQPAGSERSTEND